MQEELDSKDQKDLQLKGLIAGERMAIIASLLNQSNLQISIDIPAELESTLEPHRRFIRDHRVLWNDLTNLGIETLKTFTSTDLKEVHTKLSSLGTNVRWDGKSESPIEGYTTAMAAQRISDVSQASNATGAIDNFEFLKARNMFLHDAIIKTATTIADPYKIEISPLPHGGFTVDFRSINHRAQMINAMPLMICGAQATLAGTISDGLNICAVRNGFHSEDAMVRTLQKKYDFGISEWGNACIIAMIQAAEDEAFNQYGLLMRLIRRLTLQHLTSHIDAQCVSQEEVAG